MPKGDKRSGGRPQKYKTPEEMQEKIEAYFESCKGKVLRDADGEPIINKYGEAVIVDAHPLTVMGLTLALGFNSRQSLLNYKGKNAGFREVITQAKARIEQYAEEQLFSKDSFAGARFTLQNNFGWIEKEDEKQKSDGAGITIICDIPKPETEEPEANETKQS